jgi:2-hydroxy-3-oxopropionate reductase
MPERIGFIGLGIMGKPMVRNLLKQSYPVTVFNRSRPAIDELAAEGAAPADSPRAVAEASDVVITMLPDGPDVEAVLAGEDGVLAGARAGMLLVDMSTIAPAGATWRAEQSRAQGLGMLDAPVSGGEQGAISASLSIMVGGEADDFARATPIFEALGKTITHCGAAGAGQVVKACNQVAVALSIAATAEALALGARAGVDGEVILRVLGGGLANSRVMELRGPTMARRVFKPGFRARLHAKDLRIIMETARATQTPLPFAALADQLFTALVASGRGDFDHSGLLAVIEDLSGGAKAQDA